MLEALSKFWVYIEYDDDTRDEVGHYDTLSEAKFVADKLFVKENEKVIIL